MKAFQIYYHRSIIKDNISFSRKLYSIGIMRKWGSGVMRK